MAFILSFCFVIRLYSKADIIKSINDIDLSPDPAKQYWSSPRSWNNELIYFLLIDRFSDSKERPVDMVSPLKIKHYYKNACGGNIKGVINNLHYLKNLGITAIWISPFYENNASSYHGYAIQDFLKVDSRFGTLEELKSLVKEAHKLDIRVILDVVINHTGDNWYYQGEHEPSYYRGRVYQEGGWRFGDKPNPIELRNFNYYRKQGQVSNWDAYPETQQGDFITLKKLRLDESDVGIEVQDLLVKIYSYWIKETDCDGFRLDTVKHTGQIPVARFCDGIKEYCEKIGKKNFFIFGEIPLDYKGIKPYIEACISLSKKLNFQNLDTALDFPLYFELADVVKGNKPFSYIKDCYKLNKATFPETRLVTFLDNHDQIGAEIKERIGFGLSTNGLIGALATLLFFPGIPCIYYGTEQHLAGNGQGDECLRETLFDLEGGHSFLDEKSATYTALQELITLRTEHSDFLDGELVFNKQNTGFDYKNHSDHQDVIAFSRIINGKQLLVLFNQHATKAEVNVGLKYPVSKLSLVYNTNQVDLELKCSALEDNVFDLVKVILEPSELLILK